MTFADKDMIVGQIGKTISGLTLSKTAAMTLEVASGSVTIHQDGYVYTLDTAESHAFTADTKDSTHVIMGIITNDAGTDLWIDKYVDDGKTMRGVPPTGYELILDIAWFTIDANETDLDNVTIYRRNWI